MSTPITIRIQNHELAAELNDGPAAAALAQALPLKLSMSRWGEEYYGDCGLSLPEDAGARELMEVGEIAYWPPASALCFFFGPTPASTDQRPRAASPVVPLGRFTGSPEALKGLGPSIQAEVSRQ